MTFLYSTLGLVIMSGVLLISKHSIIFANKDFVKNNFQNNYKTSEAKQKDKIFLSILLNTKEDLGMGIDLCSNVRLKYEKSGMFDDKEINYILSGLTPSQHPDISNSCILTNGFHRVLLKKVSFNPSRYSLNSCLLYKEQFCIFEKN